MNEPDDRAPRRTLSRGIAVGLLAALLLWFTSGYLGSALGAGLPVLGVVMVVLAFVLVARGEPFGRGVGIGLLIGAAAVLLFFGALWIACMNTP